MIPRYHDADGDYEAVKFCYGCGYAITRDERTAAWKTCPLCEHKLEILRVDYTKKPRITRVTGGTGNASRMA